MRHLVEMPAEQHQEQAVFLPWQQDPVPMVSYGIFEYRTITPARRVSAPAIMTIAKDAARIPGANVISLANPAIAARREAIANPP